MACKLFMKDFTEKVINLSSNCHSCEERRRLCNNIDNEYHHLKKTESSFKEWNEYAWTDGEYMTDKALTWLHNLKVRQKPVSKNEVENLVLAIGENMDWSPRQAKRWKAHWECFEAYIPKFLIVIATFNERYVWVYDNVYDYYDNREHIDPRKYYSFKLLFFNDWIKRLGNYEN